MISSKIFGIIAIVGLSVGVVVQFFNNKDLKKELIEKDLQINFQMKKITKSETRVRELIQTIDSLEIKTAEIDTVTLRTIEKYEVEKSIINTATIDQLDSVIRSNCIILPRRYTPVLHD